MKPIKDITLGVCDGFSQTRREIPIACFTQIVRKYHNFSFKKNMVYLYPNK